MAYSDVALLANDMDFTNRVAGCVATEGNIVEFPESAFNWASSRNWEIAGTPGFGDKYAYALQTGVDRPGNDPAVITDGDILSAVQAVNVPDS